MSLFPFNLHTSPSIKGIITSDLCSKEHCLLKRTPLKSRVTQIINLSSDQSKWDLRSTYEELLSCHTGLKTAPVLLVSVPVHVEII